MTVVDAHQHFWNLEQLDYAWLHDPAFAAIDRTFTPVELGPQLDEAGVDTTVLVQSADTAADTDSMLAIAHAWNRVGAVVGWVPLADPATAAPEIERRAQDPLFVGVRHLMHNEADPDWVIQPTVLESLALLAAKGLTFDVITPTPRHLAHVHTISDAVPDLAIVIDHLGMPPIASGDTSEWAAAMTEIARRPNIVVKLSGLTTLASQGDWSADALRPVVEHALDAFGPSRLMAGNDWPVSVLTDSYAVIWQTQADTLGALSSDERAEVLGGTATAVYRVQA